MSVDPIRAQRSLPKVVSPSGVDTSGLDRAMGDVERRLLALEAHANDRLSSSGSISSEISTSPGRWLNRQVLTGTGKYVPTPGTRAVLVRMIGGGGGGGGANSVVTDSAGAGGNSGWCLEFRVATGVVSGGPFSCGAGGAAGSAVPGAGGTGGDTTLLIQGKSYTAKGGTGGGAVLDSNGAPGVPATTSTSGTGILSYYAAGQPGAIAGAGGLAYSGAGGGIVPFGSGGYSVNAGPATGGPGLGFGAGGAGAATNFFSTSGAAGSAGAIIVEEYSG